MNKKGFTLIELLTVISILGILVLLAAPKFLGHAEKANIAKMQSDIKGYETALELKHLEDESFSDSFELITQDEIDKMNASNKLLNKNGGVVQDLQIGSKYIPVENDLGFKVIHNIGGTFILSEDKSTVLFYSDKNKALEPVLPTPEPPVVEPEPTPEPPVVEPEPTPPTPQELPYTNEAFFEFVQSDSGYEVSGQGTGYYKYTGNEKVVKIPHTIKGTAMTSYYKMFAETSGVEQVISDNKNITTVFGLFHSASSESLDLSHFDTSNVTNSAMAFMYSNIKSVNLENFNTSKVNNMSFMFAYSEFESLNLLGFNTSNVTNMSYMFQDTIVQTLDLSSFELANTVNVGSAFHLAKATTGYAKNQQTADLFNNSINKEPTLTFTIK